jgi:hypothetical protein
MRDNRLVGKISNLIQRLLYGSIAGPTAAIVLALSFQGAGAVSVQQTLGSDLGGCSPCGCCPDGFTSLLTGNTLAAWHVSRSSSHGSTPDWHLENGTLIGRQQPPGKGGILLSNRRYRDVEVYLELRPDYGCDGGLFFRSDEHGRAYQVMIDYLPGGNIGGVYGEGLDDVDATSSDEWRQYWKPDAWNILRARIEGVAPHIQVWLNDHRITDWTDTANHAPGGATTGMIGLQVHGGSRWIPGGVHRFRAVAVKELP